MAIGWDDHHHNKGSDDDVNNPILTKIKFYKFCEETEQFRENNQQFRKQTQQELCRIQEALAALFAQNPNHDDKERRDNQARNPPHRGPNRNR